MKFIIKSCNLDKINTDCIIVSIFDSCKFSISANYLDQCSNGYITSLLKFGDIQGKIGETLMLYNIPKISAKRIFIVGFGKEKEINQFILKKICKNIIEKLKQTSIKNFVCSFSELSINIKNNIYWLIRSITLFLYKSLYKIRKMNDVLKKNIYFNVIILNVLKDNELLSAKKALKHALAINLGITSAKDINNLPPNICNPEYLSIQAKKLAKKYPKNIFVKIIDLEKMKKLGMNAYVAVGQGSKNKPFMSVIKYTGKNVINNKIVALVGKGLTFDSGGISIKPALNMHEMKYDMSGAAAVYGVLIAASELELPLTIIGILSGCENMPGSSSFRPGDVLTTMSGKTVEVLNTDAEGRLVLCDTLTYLERFSPNIVIDIATLTGACVTALGDSVSGFFTNSEYLSDEFEKASKETNDKIWRLPLFTEYQKQLTSSIADFSNSGNSKAGAITAACFLYNFAKKYNWVHLDIAGTAWKSQTGSTGRPVELVCQFLLNQLN
ncbi:MAG: leucyl aminopeptidase [Buchnera aphidicola (Diuraphis noxia)]